MDITLITKLVAAGAMGVSIYCIIKVYDLLKEEQKKTIQRPRFIYLAMGFAIFMTLLSLGIEFARYKMDTELSQLKDDLEDIANETYYAVDKYGNPKEIKILYRQKPFVLTKAFSKDHFKTSELKLKKQENERFFAVKESVGNEIIYGYFSTNHIKSQTRDLYADLSEDAYTPIELWRLGLSYAPLDSSALIKYPLTKDRSLAIEYWVDLLRQKGDDFGTIKENAVKLLSQRSLMEKLTADQNAVLINALKSGIRPSPWSLYELAQVYLMRSWQPWNKENAEADKNTHLQLLHDYTNYYDENTWIRDTVKYKIELQWYNECKEILR